MQTAQDKSPESGPDHATRAAANGTSEPPFHPSIQDSWLTPGRFALFLAALVFITFPGVVLGTRPCIFRDYGLFSYPVAVFQRECFWHGELPLWNPYNQCGLPFLAQWNTMCLYPPALFYLLLPLTWALPVFCLAHLVWGGLGMYFLARQWTGNRLAGSFAGLVFSFNGLNLNFMMWPSHVATFSWLPWLLWLVPQGWQGGGRKLAVAALVASMQMLAGAPEPIVLTWSVLGLLACGDLCVRKGARSRITFRFFGVVGLVSLLCAAQLLPFLQLLAHSQRNSSYAASSHDWSMPFWGWANFLVPLFRTYPVSQGVFLQVGQYWTSSYYVGVGTVLLAIIAILRGRDWRLRLCAALVFLSLVLARGDTSWLFEALHACFPGLGFVRYPIKFVILSAAIFPLIAAFGLEALLRNATRTRLIWVVFAALLLAIAGIVALERGAAYDIWQKTWHNGLSRTGFLVLILGALVLAVRLQDRNVATRLLCSVLLLLTVWLDLITHVPNQNPTAPPTVFSNKFVAGQRHWNPAPELGGSRAMLAPAARDALDRTWRPNLEANYRLYRLAARGDCNLLDRVPQLDSFFSLLPKEASTLDSLLYKSHKGDLTPLLDFMGVSQITAPGTTCDWLVRSNAMPLIAAGQRPVFKQDAEVLASLSNSTFDPRQTVFLPPEAAAIVKAPGSGAVRVFSVKVENQRVRAEVHAPSPSLVVIAQTCYPAWSARVDGTQARIWRANYAFQAVELPSGRHAVDLVYQDRTFLLGAFCSLSGSLVCGILLLSLPKDSR